MDIRICPFLNTTGDRNVVGKSCAHDTCMFWHTYTAKEKDYLNLPSLPDAGHCVIVKAAENVIGMIIPRRPNGS
jgi:hypothetical protein